MSLLYSANSILGDDVMADSGPAVVKHAWLLKGAINLKHCVNISSTLFEFQLHLILISLCSHIFTQPQF